MNTQVLIASTPILGLDRHGFFALFFAAAHRMRAQELVCLSLGRVSEREVHCPWSFYRLSNDGFYLAPICIETLPSLYVGREFDGRLSSDAAGIVATLLTTSQLAREFCADYLVRAHDRLLEFSSHHVERVAIERAVA